MYTTTRVPLAVTRLAGGSPAFLYAWDNLLTNLLTGHPDKLVCLRHKPASEEGIAKGE